MIERIRKSFASAGECYHGGKVREAAATGRMPLDFSANINPLGSPPLEALVAMELKNIRHYPDNRYRDLKDACARFAGVEPESIVPGNGSSEIIRLFAETVLEYGDLVLVPTPTFGEYENQSRLSGGRIEYLDLDDSGELDLSRRDLTEAKVLFLCNPNNPTGALLSREYVSGIADRCERSRTFLLVDEAFIELSDPEQSVADLAPDREYLFVMRSLTKSFGVPGLRLGFGVTNPILAGVMNTARIPWSISSIASAAGSYLLGQEDFLAKSRELIRSELAWLTSALKRLGLNPRESKVNFILVNIKSSGLTSQQIVSGMLSEGVLVRDCQSFGLGQDYIRVAVRNREENEQLIAALERAIRCAE